MRAVLVAFIAFSGWFVAGLYLVYEYEEYGPKLLNHLLFPTQGVGVFYHVVMLTAPVVSMFLAFFMNERMKLVAGLRAVEERYRDYFDNAPSGYLSFGADGTVLDANRTAQTMLGYKRGEMVGCTNIGDLVVSPEALEPILRDLREKGRVEARDMRFRRHDGRTLPVTMSSTAVYDKDGRFLRSRTILKDETERKGYEEVLKRVAEDWRSTFDSMPWGVMLLGADFRVMRANAYVSELTGCTPEELARTRCTELMDGGDGFNDGAPRVLEYEVPGLGRSFRLYGRPIIEEGEEPSSYVFSLVDVTDIKQGQRKLLDSRNAFFNMLKDVTAANREMKDLYGNLILSFANAIDAKSPWTKGHSERVCQYATALARELGLGEEQMANLRTASLLHDVGKIGTYDYLLDKADGLTAEEFEMVKMHPEKSAQILAPITRFREIVDVVRYHHEQYGGSGYPRGLRGEDIPLLARILCVADSYDSMTADRPYRPSPGKDFAMSELRACAGTHFDPVVVEAFLRLLHRGEV
ncbi:MAG: PAS domain S-box protein [Nitrospirota bacterium]|jgi:PAS domain S-box-containing protein/putative nucleotidyltransferase with HDIG domain